MKLGLANVAAAASSLSVLPTRRRRAVGIALFLAVTACWMFGLASAEQDWIAYHDVALLIAVVLSAVSVVITGYLGRIWDALWLGWIPGATMMAIGFAMTPEPGADEAGAGMVFFGGLVLALGWPAFFFPLVVVGAELRGRRARRAAQPSEGAMSSRD